MECARVPPVHYIAVFRVVCKEKNYKKHKMFAYYNAFKPVPQGPQQMYRTPAITAAVLNAKAVKVRCSAPGARGLVAQRPVSL